MTINFKAKFLNHTVANSVFIECGTFLGETLINAAKYCEDCHGIEIVPDIYQKTLDKIQKNNLSNVSLHLGNSIDVLPEIIDPTRSTTFFLDSHYTAANRQTDPVKELAGTECPLLKEVDIIAEQDWKASHMVIIDDWMMFSHDFWRKNKKSEKYKSEDWPRKEEIIDVFSEYRYVEISKTKGVFVYEMD